MIAVNESSQPEQFCSVRFTGHPYHPGPTVTPARAAGGAFGNGMNAASGLAIRLRGPHMDLVVDQSPESNTMTQDTEVQGLQSKAEARLAALKEEKLVTRISVLSTLLAQGKKTERLMIRMSVETHKTAPDFDQKKCTQAKSRIMQALGDIDCDVFIEMDR